MASMGVLAGTWLLDWKGEGLGTDSGEDMVVVE